MNKQTIKLTESELHNIIKEAVTNILENENIEEGFLNTAKSFIGQYGRRGANKAQQMGTQLKQKMNDIKQGAQNVANNVKQGYNNVKNDIQQTARNAKQDSSMKEMQKAFNNFKAAVETYKANGGKVNGQLGSRISGIDNMINNYNQHF